MADGTYDINSISDALKSLANEAAPTQERFAWAFSQMIGGAEALNKTFGQGRQRITELMVAVADATPAVDRLGGNLKDAVETIQSISEATSRNITASADEVSKLFSASKLLNKSVDSIVSGFQDVGVQFSQIGGQLEQSLQYVQNIGGNAGQIMGRVLDDMSALNKYNFENGVVGLTKMAAQASMLKFDMRTTFELADKAMSPDGAIELASAFQRLGVAAGDLTDPFELMYKSLNDPGGLQDSLVEMTKQYTYFDEKTKSFKISPAGILQLKELQNQTGLSAQEMSKMALNAADLDKKLSQLKPSIKFENEEDKMYLANIAKMGVGGEYEVKVSDTETKRLQDVTQEEFNKLIKQQKDGPKTLEDIQRSQLDAFTIVRGDVRSIRDKIVFGVTSSDTLRTEGEGVNRLLRQFTEKTEREFDQKYFRDKAQGGIDTIKDIVSAISKGEDVTPELKKAFDSAFKTMVEAGEKADEGTKSVIDNLLKDIKPITWAEKSAIDILKGIQKDESGKETKQQTKQKPSTGVGTTSLNESFKSGSASIADKVHVTNELTRDGNVKLDNIAKSLFASKETVTISDNAATVFKNSSVGISDKVGITNDLTKISNDKLDSIHRALSEAKKDDVRGGMIKETTTKNNNPQYNSELTAIADSMSKALNTIKNNGEKVESTKQPVIINPNEVLNDKITSLSDSLNGLMSAMKNSTEKVEPTKQTVIVNPNEELSKNISAFSDSLNGLMSAIDNDRKSTTEQPKTIINPNINANETLTATIDNLSKGMVQAKETSLTPVDRVDNFSTSVASLVEKINMSSELSKSLVDKIDLLTTQIGQTVKLESVGINRNDISDAVSKVQPTVNTGDRMVKHQHDFDGTITWKIDAPPELDTKRFYAMIDKQEFRDAFTKIVVDKFKETENSMQNNMS